MEFLSLNYDDLDMDPDTTTTYEGKPFTGLAWEQLGNGNLANDLFYKGVLWGPSRIWAPNGALIEEWWHFRVDSFHGINQTWTPDGALVEREEYWNGKVVSSKTWDEQGELEEESELSDAEKAAIGYEAGKWRDYFDQAGDATMVLKEFETRHNGKFEPSE